jgi:hypothetical protein
VTGKLDSKGARARYTEAMKAFNAGEKPKYMQRLALAPGDGDTRGPRRPDDRVVLVGRG